MHEAAQNFELLSNIQDKKKTNKKHIAVDVLFKAYPLSCRSNLAGQYLQVVKNLIEWYAHSLQCA